MTSILPVSTVLTKDNVLVDIIGLLYLKVPMPATTSAVSESSVAAMGKKFASVASKKPWAVGEKSVKEDSTDTSEKETTHATQQNDSTSTTKPADESKSNGASDEPPKAANAPSNSSHPLRTICYSQIPNPVNYVTDLATRVLQSMAMDMTEEELGLALTNVWVNTDAMEKAYTSTAAEPAPAAGPNAPKEAKGASESAKEKASPTTSESANAKSESTSTRIFTSPLGLRLVAMVNEALGPNFIKITECDLTWQVRMPYVSHNASAGHQRPTTASPASDPNSDPNSSSPAPTVDAYWKAYYENYFAEHPYYHFERHQLMRNVAIQSEAQLVWAEGVAKSIGVISKAIEANGAGGQRAAEFLAKVGGGLPPTSSN
eukprot:GILI01018021.1.p1 GENE.GILI01018021.1~~GILI01018021.1.p1  ORF type:complete len:399 (+),score=60.02 GILI01018021.1:76-1197(+)